MTVATHPTKQPDSGMAITAMVLGVLSILGFGLLLGIPAIVLASIALKNKAGGRELSIAGLVTGIIGTVLSLLLLAFIAVVIIFAADQPSDAWPQPAGGASSEQRLAPLRV